MGEELAVDEPDQPLLDVPSGWVLALALVGALALAAWGNAIVQGLSQPSDAAEIGGSADLATARMVGALSVAGGITGGFFVLLAFALLFSARR